MQFKNKAYFTFVFAATGIFLAIILYFKSDFLEFQSNFKEINSLVGNLNKEYKVKGEYDITIYDEEGSIKVFNSTGELYATLPPEKYKSKRIYRADSNEVTSLLFIEDKKFLYRDLSFSLKGLARAIIKIHVSGEKQGGSGITQQLVKNIVINDNSSTIARKYKELLVSYYIDKTFSRTEIVNSYLNQISYGKNIYGIQKAGEQYLGKVNLNIEESFFLNSMLKQPSYYYTNQEKLRTRAKYYYREYAKSEGYSEATIKESESIIDTLSLEYRNENQLLGSNAYIRDKVRSFTEKKRLKEMKLAYSLEIEKERKLVEDIKVKEKEMCANFDICDVGIVVLSPEKGSVVFQYGGEYKKSQVDSTSSSFELGSTLKPFLYAQYFDTYGNVRSFSNGNVCIGTYCPENWDKSNSVSVDFNTAINLSYNKPVISIIKHYVSLENFYDLLVKLGIYQSSDGDLNSTIVLGTKGATLFELTKAYLSLIDGHIYSGDLFSGLEKGEKIFKDESIKYIGDTLKKNGHNANYSIKTGTTSSFKEHYIMAYNQDRVIGIWMGNKDGSKTKEGIYSISKGKALLDIVITNLENQ